jgi:hypothetical protein
MHSAAIGEIQPIGARRLLKVSGRRFQPICAPHPATLRSAQESNHRKRLTIRDPLSAQDHGDGCRLLNRRRLDQERITDGISR